jgi:cyclohexadieny/prephenate dehydrogenase
MSLQFERVAIIGIGLIGSSLCHVIRREKIAGHIAGYAKSAETRNVAFSWAG